MSIGGLRSSRSVLIERVVSRPIYCGMMPWIVSKYYIPGTFWGTVNGIAAGFAFLFCFNAMVGLPLVKVQDDSKDVLGIAFFKSSSKWFTELFSRFFWPRVARFITFCIILDQTNPLFSFLVYRKEGKKGMGLDGVRMFMWHNALISLWWAIVYTLLIKFFEYVVCTCYVWYYTMMCRP